MATLDGIRSARERAVRGRKEHVEEALSSLKELRAENAQRFPCRRKDPSELRVPMTDPDAAKMKMLDGRYRPAYNVQFATTVEGGAIVAAAVTNEGVDSGQIEHGEELGLIRLRRAAAPAGGRSPGLICGCPFWANPQRPHFKSGGFSMMLQNPGRRDAGAQSSSFAERGNDRRHSADGANAGTLWPGYSEFDSRLSLRRNAVRETPLSRSERRR
jgi:hypothetical protein